MRLKHNRQGVTLFEMLITAVLVGPILVGVALMMKGNFTFFKRTGVRQDVLSQSRTAIDTILRMLRQARPNTLVISTPAAAEMIPNSRVDFILQTVLPSGATAYALYLENGTVFSREFVPPGGPQPPRALASHVTGLLFTGSSLDPSIVSVSLQMEVPWDATNDPTHVTKINIPNQVVHLTGSQ